MPISAESLTLAALLIAPGVIAVLVGITLGVVEQAVDRDKLYLSSFVSSLLIDVIFISVIQSRGFTVNERDQISSIFFQQEGFQIEAVALLFALSLTLGIVYAILLRFNVAHWFRNQFGRLTSHQRNPWQPWEGGLRDAEQVMVELDNGDDIVGMLSEYSRVGKERQIVLQNPMYPQYESKPQREKVILTENKISVVHIMTTQQRKSVFQRLKNVLGIHHIVAFTIAFFLLVRIFTS